MLAGVDSIPKWYTIDKKPVKAFSSRIGISG
jgi:hypothetical protein